MHSYDVHEPRRSKHISFKRVVELYNSQKIHKSHREALRNRFAYYHAIVDLRKPTIEASSNIPSLPMALELLGNATASLMMLNSISDLIGETLAPGSMGGGLYYKWPEELFQQRTLTLEMIKTCEHMVWAMSKKEATTNEPTAADEPAVPDPRPQT